REVERKCRRTAMQRGDIGEREKDGGGGRGYAEVRQGGGTERTGGEKEDGVDTSGEQVKGDKSEWL
ncbi:hypothetical protein, partial [Burkholderia sp. Ac-20379]|uniref:hypothetical protein n=1 Tax=Burkholderia sp. Ac-20379 TaxID=2703900 RepID=UPI001980D55B